MQNDYEPHEYRQHEVVGASPVRLVAMVYNLAIRACEQKDFNRATKAVSVLRDALDHDYSEVAVGLFGLFQWCLDCIRKEDYHNAAVTLRELREAWVSVENQFIPVKQKNEVTAAPPSDVINP